MAIYTTEITSDKIVSDNPVHQRLLKAYYVALPYITGDLMEVGCGEGRGVKQLAPLADSYTAIDKIGEVIEQLSEAYPEYQFRQLNIPPIVGIEDNSFDTIVTFQVIEHIKKDELFLEEIHRILRPGGKVLITTPNIKKSLTRNPWHIREYTADQLKGMCESIFSKVEMKGIDGNEKVMEYYERNKKSVQKITKWDVLNLQYKLPAPLLRIPYEIMNRLNRNKLSDENELLVSEISHEDYIVSDNGDESLDLFVIAEK